MTKPRAHLFTAAAFFTAGILHAAPKVDLTAPDTAYAKTYAVVVSEKTYRSASWKEATDALVAKRGAKLLVYKGADVAGARAGLAGMMPRRTAFVARPEEATRAYIGDIHTMVRGLDADPYDDTSWGVVTGIDATGAKRVALAGDIPPIDTVLGTTGIDLAPMKEGYYLSDGIAGMSESKKPGDKAPVKTQGHDKPDALVWKEQFIAIRPKLIVTSSHGFQHGFEMPFSRGFIHAKEGRLYALKGAKPDSEQLAMIPPTDTPRVWHAAGNCLIGHITDKNCVTPVMLSNYGAAQVAAYTVATWDGSAGWGSLRLWQSDPGRYTMAEAVFLNHQVMLHKLAKISAKARDFRHPLDESKKCAAPSDDYIKAIVADGIVPAGDIEKNKPEALKTFALLWDRDTFALYGDPAVAARFITPEAGSPFETSLVSAGENRHRFVVKVRDKARAKELKDPVGMFFTTRLSDVKIISGEKMNPVLADNFILLPNPALSGGEDIEIEFTGVPAK